MEQINLRSIQHYMYCPHRWGLCEIEKLWADNMFVAHADLMHARAHNSESSRSFRGVKTFCAVSVYNDLPEYRLYGITDCIEARKAVTGVSLEGEEGHYQLCIVEYKPTKPKIEDYNHSDLMQIFAQKICVDYIFGGDCEAVIYYDDVKKRVALPVKEKFNELDKELRITLKHMRNALSNGEVPIIPKNQKCSGCSMKDICLPTKKAKYTLKKLIADMMEDIE